MGSGVAAPSARLGRTRRSWCTVCESCRMAWPRPTSLQQRVLRVAPFSTSWPIAVSFFSIDSVDARFDQNVATSCGRAFLVKRGDSRACCRFIP